MKFEPAQIRIKNEVRKKKIGLLQPFGKVRLFPFFGKGKGKGKPYIFSRSRSRKEKRKGLVDLTRDNEELVEGKKRKKRKETKPIYHL